MAGEDSTLIDAGSEYAHGQTRCAEERSHNRDPARPTDLEEALERLDASAPLRIGAVVISHGAGPHHRAFDGSVTSRCYADQRPRLEWAMLAFGLTILGARGSLAHGSPDNA
jgi:hypothetical protein